RNYKHLGYQLNGINRFLEKEEKCKKHIKIILIDNSSPETTNESINNFIKAISENKRYIIIATMSDIFDSLLGNIGYKLNNKNYRKMVKIIGTLASQSEQYQNYESYENVIRLSPPDFDEARKATSNIVTKLISSFCPSSLCEYHKNNNIILISSNSYGDAVKKSFSKLFTEQKDEFDTSTNIHVDAKELNKGIFKFTYHYDIEKGIMEDADTNYTFNDLLDEKVNHAINTIFIIGYEPNISNILNQINDKIRLKKLNNSEFSILISATASVKEWRESITETINNLDIKDLIHEVNFIKIEYPEFRADDAYHSKKIHFKLYELNSKTHRLFKESDLTFRKEEIEEIIYKANMNYINGFIYMSLEFVQQINAEWDINLLSLKEKLFHNKDRNNKDITGVKILSSGDSINHFKVKPLELS
ncbi:MAG: hypothetical protein K0U38_10225, partial [Epsilonproteobacteria bacterium]|nr:hypothetical protein [Campylobacterota bacterium]